MEQEEQEQQAGHVHVSTETAALGASPSNSFRPCTALTPVPGLSSGHTSTFGVQTTMSGWAPHHLPRVCLQRDGPRVQPLSSLCRCGCWTYCKMGMGTGKPPRLERAVMMGRGCVFFLSLEAVPTSTHLHAGAHSRKLPRGQKTPEGELVPGALLLQWEYPLLALGWLQCHRK